MLNDAEDQTVRLCIPNDVQFTIIGAQEDRLKIKFDQSRQYEKRLGMSSARANDYASHFFCFDYLGSDSLRADMLSPTENYKGIPAAEAEIVIDISRRTSPFNSASKQMHRADPLHFDSEQPVFDSQLEAKNFCSHQLEGQPRNDVREQQPIRRKSQEGLHRIQNNDFQQDYRRVFASEASQPHTHPQVPAEATRDRNEHQTFGGKTSLEARPVNHHIPEVEKQNKTAKPQKRPSDGSNASSEKGNFVRDSLEAARGPPKEPSVPTPVPIVHARNVVSENNVTSKAAEGRNARGENPPQDFPKTKSEFEQPKSLYRSIGPNSELSATDYKLGQDANPFDKKTLNQKTHGQPSRPGQHQKRTDSGIPLSSAGSDQSPKSEYTRERRQLLLNNLSYLEQEIKKVQGQGRLTSEEEGYLQQMYHKLNDVKERLSLLDPGLDPFRKTFGDRATIESGFKRRNMGQAEAYNPDNLSSDHKKNSARGNPATDQPTSINARESKQPPFVEGNSKLEKEHFIFKKKLTQLTSLGNKPHSNQKRIPTLKDSPRNQYVPPPPVSKTTKNTDRTTIQSKTGILKNTRVHSDVNGMLQSDKKKQSGHDACLEESLMLRRKSQARSKHHTVPAYTHITKEKEISMRGT